MTQGRYRDYKGVLHVHSNLSDGTATLAEIAASARQAGLDFVGLADHERRKPHAAAATGWQDGVLLVVGKEISHPCGHYLAFGMGSRRGLKRMPLRLSLAELRQRGALSFVAHPCGLRKPLFRINARCWRDWTVDGFTGLEIWSYMLDWIRELRVSNAMELVYNATAAVSGPPPQALRIWDQLGETRKVVGIAGLDTHGHRPLPKFVTSLVKNLPDVVRYEKTFETVRTHVLGPPFNGVDGQDADSLLASLAKGRCYMAFDQLHDATGFEFRAERGGCEWVMGEEAIGVDGPVFLHAALPTPAHIRLLRSGQLVAQNVGRELRFRAEQSGVYRVEARLKDRPWVFSNPIYLRPRREND